ncbi:MAG: DNA recombination protein RmuC [Candidatus Peregrinibacteria bacterium]
MLTSLIFIGVIVCIALLGIVAWKSFTADTGEDATLRHMVENLQKDLQEERLKDREHLQQRLDHVSKLVNENVRDSTRQGAAIIREVTEKLTKLDATNKQVLGFSEQLKDLESILKQPKGKGLLSEYWLETLLGHVLSPTQYQMQYKFKNGEIVDAVVFFQDTIIPIDAKFSSAKYQELLKLPEGAEHERLEKGFKEDLKKRIDETAKYIRPGENTADFAFMFLPAEGIFYDLLVQKVGTIDINKATLMEYAFGKRVVIASPATFFAYLQTVLQGLKAFKMQESVRDILKLVENLGRHVGSYETYMQKLGNNLGTTVNMYNEAYKEFGKIDRDVLKLTEGRVGGTVEALPLDKPTAHIETTFEAIAAKNAARAS